MHSSGSLHSEQRQFLTYFSGQKISPIFRVQNLIFLDFWTLTMGLIVCPETSVRSYHYSLRMNPAEGSSFSRLTRHSNLVWCPTFLQLMGWLHYDILQTAGRLVHSISKFVIKSTHSNMHDFLHFSDKNADVTGQQVHKALPPTQTRT